MRLLERVKMSKRTKLLNLLEAYTPSAQEQECKKRMIQFVRNHEDCFERTLEIGHITASAWLTTSDFSRFLLMHHRKLNMWVQPGGHCDGESNVLAVALKEVFEETGLTDVEPVSTALFDIDIHHIPEYKNVPAHDHYDVRFLISTPDKNMIVQNHESKELKWFEFNDQIPTQEPSVVRMAQKWHAYISSQNMPTQETRKEL